MNLATQLGDSTDGVFPLVVVRDVRHNGVTVGRHCHTSAGFRDAYVSERWRSQGHRYEKRNAYAVSTSLLNTPPVTDTDCIIIIDHDTGEAYIYNRELFSMDSTEAIRLSWEDEQLAVPVELATTTRLPDELYTEST